MRKRWRRDGGGVVNADAVRLRCELHLHTVFSHDGHIRPAGLARAAQRLGLNLVAITDHDTMAGVEDFRRRLPRWAPDLLIVAGEERTLADGTHLLGLALREPVQSHTLADALAEIQAQGGLAILPHPCRRRDGVCQETVPEAALGADGFELFNPKCSHRENAAARRLGASLPPCGGSDAHYESDIGQCIITLPWQGDAAASLRSALQHRSLQIVGIRQSAGDLGRRYAPAYYRMKSHFPLPRILVPLARVGYRAWRNGRRRWTAEPTLELKQ
ncbi:MAG: PHP domain-containing protein [Terriglobales bacterium]